MPILTKLNKDIEDVQVKNVVVKHREVIGGGGFFETQVEVIEREEVI